MSYGSSRVGTDWFCSMPNEFFFCIDLAVVAVVSLHAFLILCAYLKMASLQNEPTSVSLASISFAPFVP